MAGLYDGIMKPFLMIGGGAANSGTGKPGFKRLYRLVLCLRRCHYKPSLHSLTHLLRGLLSESPRSELFHLQQVRFLCNIFYIPLHARLRHSSIMTQTDAQSDSEEGLTREEMQQEEEDEPPSKRAKQDACKYNLILFHFSSITIQALCLSKPKTKTKS